MIMAAFFVYLYEPHKSYRKGGRRTQRGDTQNSSCYNYIKWIRFNYSPKRGKGEKKRDNDDHGVTATATATSEGRRNKSTEKTMYIFRNYTLVSLACVIISAN